MTQTWRQIRRVLTRLSGALLGALALPFVLLDLLHPLPEGVVLSLDQGLFVPGEMVRGGDAPQDAVPVSLPHDWHGAWTSAQGTYYFHLDLAVPPDRLWAIYLPTVAMNAAVYLNGEILGHGGAMSPSPARHWSRPLYFLVPNGLLRSGRNLLAIQVAAEPPGSGLLDIAQVGAHEAMRGAFELRYAMTTVATFAITLLMSTVAALMFVLWASRRQETVYLWFALACSAWCVHLLNFIVVDPPMPVKMWEWLWFVSMAWLVIFTVIFVLRFLGLSAPLVERVFLGLGAMSAVALAVLAQGWPAAFDWVARHPWATGVLALGVYPLVLLVRQLARRPTSEVGWLLFAGLTMFCLAAHDWLLFGGRVPRVDGFLTHYSAPVVLLSFGYILVRRFVDALRLAESLNLELERRVADREKEIEHNHERLRQLEREQAVATERERLMRDMHDGVGGTILSALNLAQHPDSDRQRIVESLRQALQDLRLMIDSLDPLEGDISALLGMFRARVEPQLRAVGMQSRWSLGDLPPCTGLTPERALHLLRITQEAVNNVVKHAHAHHLVVELTAGTDVLGRPAARLRIADDGHGFDRNSVPTGRGVRNMHRRALSAGLDLSIESGPHGTQILVVMPMADSSPG